MRLFVVLCFLPFFLIGFTDNNTKINSFAGHAFDLKSNKAIYSEFHEEEFHAGQHKQTLTLYKDPKGKLLAKRKLTFSGSNEHPNYRLDVLKMGYYEGAEVVEGNVKVFNYDVVTRKELSKTLAVTAPYVIDGGLSYFIKKKWTQIMTGKAVSFNFVVPARLDYYRFRVRKISTFEDGGRKAVLVSLEPDHFILRSLIDPIKITYDVASKRIIRYEGISNIPKDGDRNFDAKLVYPDLGA